MEFAYYPGCSLDSTAKEYDMSVHAVCKELDVGLKEIPDWNCCGASSGHSTNLKLSLALPGRNLAIAEKEGMDLAVSCPACFLRFKKVVYDLKHDEKMREEIVRIMDMPYEGTQKTRHILDIIYHDVGLDAIKGKVTKPLKGLKAVSYYGCLLVRPPKVTEFGEHENPVMMDEVMEAIGAEPLDWSGKIDCCGGSLALTRTDIVYKLIDDLIVAARKAGANCIVAACPLCQANLDTRQKGGKEEPLPVLYFTELLGISFGLSGINKWLKRHVISPSELLRENKLI
jgi:heterodisulfide reductase subunit B